jgi:DNA-directed RNA polymerase subunit RPC12/RpoP
VKTYSIPDRELDALRDLGMSFAEARTQPDGYLASWIERGRTQRDGRTVVTMQERGQGWAVEITLDANGDVAHVLSLPPDQARALECEHDISEPMLDRHPELIAVHEALAQRRGGEAITARCSTCGAALAVQEIVATKTTVVSCPCGHISYRARHA